MVWVLGNRGFRKKILKYVLINPGYIVFHTGIVIQRHKIGIIMV